MDEYNLDNLLDETDQIEKSDTPALAPAGESAMVSPDSGQSSQESDATEPDAAEVDGATKTSSPQPSQDEEVLPPGTPGGQNDLGADESLRSENTGPSSPEAEDRVIPFPDSSASERFSEPVPPKSEEEAWPEISPPRDRQAWFQQFQLPQRSQGFPDSQQAQESPQMAASLVQPVFNVTVTSGDDMVSRLGEEINPRLQQLQQLTEFHANDVVSEFSDLLSLGAGGEF